MIVVLLGLCHCWNSTQSSGQTMQNLVHQICTSS